MRIRMKFSSMPTRIRIRIGKSDISLRREHRAEWGGGGGGGATDFGKVVVFVTHRGDRKRFIFDKPFLGKKLF